MGQKTVFVADYALTPREKIRRCALLCEKGVFRDVGCVSCFDLPACQAEGIVVHEFPGTYALPGFVDTHIHGAAGFDSSTPTDAPHLFDKMCMALARHGVTAFLPTVVSLKQPAMLEALAALAKQIEAPHSGASPLGIHVEGPFINPEKHGAQEIDSIRPIDIGEAREMLAAGGGHVKAMTFAPELPRAAELVEFLLSSGVIPSMGHSKADYETARRMFEAGARNCTHIYNGMGELHHRNAGLAALALTEDDITVSIILDGVHIHPAMVYLACRAKPKDKIVGISDAVAATGLRDGASHIGATRIDVRGGRATTLGGVIAGTTLTLERGWGHLRNFAKLDAASAAACMTINPCRALGLKGRGEILPGRAADIAFFGVEDNAVKATVKGGELVYLAEGYRPRA